MPHFSLDAKEHFVNINANADVLEVLMTLFAATLFALALGLSLYAMLATAAGKWDRIVTVTTSRGVAVERVIRLGEQRYTGARLRVVGGCERTDHWAGALALHGAGDQGELKLAA